MDRGQQILNFLRQYLSTHGFAPNLREIADGIGLKSASDIGPQLERLEQAGLIERSPGKARAIRVKDGVQ